MEPHSFLPEGSAFLPINCCVAHTPLGEQPSPRSRFPLVLVDADRVAELKKYNWRTSPSRDLQVAARVFRYERKPHYIDPQTGKPFTLRISLAEQVRGILESANDTLEFLNGDQLDLRAANIFPVAELAVRGLTEVPVAHPGSSFCRLPEYRDAAKDYAARAKELAARFPKGRATSMSLEQVQTMLNELADPQNAHLFKGQTMQAFIDQTLSQMVGARPNRMSLWRILRGLQQRIDGFDYSKIEKIFPLERSKSKRLARLAFALGSGPAEKPVVNIAV